MGLLRAAAVVGAVEHRGAKKEATEQAEEQKQSGKT